MRTVKARFELFDHTADMGVRVVAPSRAALVEPAVQGLYAVLGQLVAGAGSEPLPFAATDAEVPVLLRDFLADMLRLFETRRRMVTAVRVDTFDESRLSLTAETADVDESRSVLEREVKAITYHGLDVRTVPGGYEATFIVDI
jgi:SHS2 domain-containing protein